ncbi:MAG TPA: hypothetical protein VFH27_07085 [Longimicrobiaceae bacterium]|nr:hypothetical protein [Longimicrobiaceae bacterium]
MKGMRKILPLLGIAATSLLVVGAASPGDAPEHDWTGAYAIRMRVGSVTRMPLMGRERSVTTTLVMAGVRRGPQGWVQSHRVCDVRIEGRIPMTVPPAFVASLPAREFAASFPTAIVGSPYALDMGTEAIGFDAAATGGRVPTQASDPGARDSDGDGNPGATIHGHFPLFGDVSIYFAQRLHLALRGTQVAPGRIAGTLDVLDLRQETLGASSRFFRRTLDVRPDAAASTFVMVAIPAPLTCGELRQREAALFR